AIFSLDSRRAEAMRRTNARATELVLNSATQRGLDPIVYVSTTVALTRYGGSSPDLPLGDIARPYAQSKIASEQRAPRLQDTGAPVVTVYPGAVYGPNDPYRGAQTEQGALDTARRVPDISPWRSACRRRARCRHPDSSRALTARSPQPLHRARPPYRRC